MINKLDGTFVVPGEKLGVVEEFEPGRGTVEVGGVVYSSQTGVASTDPKRHIVSVKTATAQVVVPEEGSTIIGIVEKVQEKMAIINMIVVDGKKMELPFTGMLHVSNSSPRFERTMWDVVKPNDIIRAKVIDTSQRIAKLTSVGRDLGVTKAYCSKCGNELVLSGHILRCSVCRNVERRRLAEDFHSEASVTS